MIVGIGTDIVEIGRVESSISLFGDRFISRVFTDGEASYCRERGASAAASFAARFAAKEAASKALGTGVARGIRWTDIEVLREGGRAPFLSFTGRAAEWAARRGVTRAHLSLSHTHGFAVAFVVLEA